eukprot:jgi/Undpi1/2034/HiC_scaffold_12.g05420.m1
MPPPLIFFAPACLANLPVCVALTGAGVVYAAAESRREAKASAEESAAAGLVGEEITAVKALTVIPKAVGAAAFPLRGKSELEWARHFAKAGVANLRIDVGEGGARVGDLKGVGRAVVPFVGGNGVGCLEGDFCRSGGGFLPGNGGVAGAPGASVLLVMTRVTVDTDPAVGARVEDLEGVGRAVVPFVGGNGVGCLEGDFCRSGGGFLPGNGGVAGAPGASVLLVMTRVTVDTDPAVGDSTWEVSQDWRAIVPWRQGDDQGGEKRDIVLGEGVCLPGRAGVAAAPGAAAGSVVVPFTAQLCPLVVLLRVPRNTTAHLVNRSRHE